MDKTDMEILNILSKNSRETVSEISKKIYLSVPAVSERIKKLKDNGIIKEYTIKLNRQKLGFDLLANIFVNIDKSENIDGFREKIVKFPEVLECYHIIGEYDYLLKVLLKNTPELEAFITNKLKKIKGVANTNTIIILSTMKEEINRSDEI